MLPNRQQLQRLRAQTAPTGPAVQAAQSAWPQVPQALCSVRLHVSMWLPVPAAPAAAAFKHPLLLMHGFWLPGPANAAQQPVLRAMAPSVRLAAGAAGAGAGGVVPGRICIPESCKGTGCCGRIRAWPLAGKMPMSWGEVRDLPRWPGRPLSKSLLHPAGQQSQTLQLSQAHPALPAWGQLCSCIRHTCSCSEPHLDVDSFGAAERQAGVAGEGKVLTSPN